MAGMLAADGVVRMAHQSRLAQLYKPCCVVAAAVLHVVKGHACFSSADGCCLA